MCNGSLYACQGSLHTDNELVNACKACRYAYNAPIKACNGLLHACNASLHRFHVTPNRYAEARFPGNGTRRPAFTT